MLKKTDILAAFTIGELTALILLGISKNIKELEQIPFLWLGCIIFPLLAILGILIASFLAKKIPIIFQTAKFFLIGVLNTFIDLGILNFLMWVFAISSGIPYSIFKSFSFGCSVINSYFWNKSWAFSSSAQSYGGSSEAFGEGGKKNENKFSHHEFSGFCLISVISFFLNVSIASLLVNVLGPQFGLSQVAWANTGAIIATCFAWICNFFGYKFLVFKK